MIKMRNLIYDPFNGKMHEGLIYSLELDKAIERLKADGFSAVKEFTRAYKESTNSYIVELHPKYASGPYVNYLVGFYDEKISELLVLSNNLGYFPSFTRWKSYPAIKLEKYSQRLLRKIYEEEEPETIWITFNKKFDRIVRKEDLPETIYHLTESKHIEKIKKIGLKPSAKMKLKSHLDRVYFLLSIDDAPILWSSEQFKNSDTIVAIETESLSGITFYHDPDFIHKSIYTFDNIPAKNIIDIYPYTEQ